MMPKWSTALMLCALALSGGQVAHVRDAAGETSRPRSADRPDGPAVGNHTRGEELFNASCVVCHGPRAAGGIGPRLAGNRVLSDDRAFDKVLSEGRHMMPPLKDAVSPQQLADIRAWLQTLP